MPGRMKLLHPLAATALVLSPLSAFAKDKPPISLTRTGKWEINYDEDSCHLFAQFGEGRQAALLKLTRVGPSDWFEMQVYGEMLKWSGINMPIEVSFGDEVRPFKREGVAVTLSQPGKLPAVIIQGLRIDGWDNLRDADGPVASPAITPQQEASVTAITFKVRASKPYRLQTGSLEAPMAAMRRCTDDLLRHWGYDPAVQKSLVRQTTPANYPGNWITQRDFPPRPLARGSNGLVQFRLDVDEAGSVRGCRVLFRTNPDEFADLSCQLLSKRAKFTPALNAEGKPVRSYYVGRVKWVSGGW
jgi:hypothetical protein